jgi:molecular chaperone HtpG
VDDFWTTATYKYRDYQFKSITRADIDLDNLDRSENDSVDAVEFDDDKDKREEAEKAKELEDAREDGYKNLLELFRTTLENCNLKDIRISKKLTKSPICLVADEKAMDIKLERFLLEQKQIVAPMPKILEINPQHSLLEIIQKNIDNAEKLSDMKDIIKTLFDEACILEGEPLKNPAEFVVRLNKFMETVH